MLLPVSTGAPAEQYKWSTDRDTFDFDDSQVKQWEESKVPIPPYPQDRDLLPVPLMASDTQKLYLDGSSLSVADDQVTRYVFVLESPSGARSVFFDGLRCQTGEYKTYAIGTSERTLIPAKNPTWRTIPIVEHNAVRHKLYREYLCDKHTPVRSAVDLKRLLQSRP